MQLICDGFMFQLNVLTHYTALKSTYTGFQLRHSLYSAKSISLHLMYSHSFVSAMSCEIMNAE